MGAVAVGVYDTMRNESTLAYQGGDDEVARGNQAAAVVPAWK